MSNSPEMNGSQYDRKVEETEEDPEIAMQKMMGFSNFNTSQRPPRKQQRRDDMSSSTGRVGTGANSQPLTTSRMNMNTSAAKNDINNDENSSTRALYQTLTSSIPPSTHNSSIVSIPPQTRPQSQLQSNRAVVESNINSNNTYTHPKSGITLSAQDLSALQSGVMKTEINSQGQEEKVMTYFRTSFVATPDQLWGQQSFFASPNYRAQKKVQQQQQHQRPR